MAEEYVAQQVKVPATDFGAYDWQGTLHQVRPDPDPGGVWLPGVLGQKIAGP